MRYPRRLAACTLAAAGLLLPTGCASMLIADRMERNLQSYSAPEPSLYVHDSDALARVSKVVVPDFRLKLISGSRQPERMFEGSPAQGTLHFAASEIGSVMAEFFEEELIKVPGLDVLERNQLRHLLAEQHMQMSGLVDVPTVAAGKLAGADAILLGTVSQGIFFQPNDPLLPSFVAIAIHLRLLDLKTGRILMVYRDRQLVSGSFPDEDRLHQSLARRFVERIQSYRRPQS